MSGNFNHRLLIIQCGLNSLDRSAFSYWSFNIQIVFEMNLKQGKHIYLVLLFFSSDSLNEVTYFKSCLLLYTSFSLLNYENIKKTKYKYIYTHSAFLDINTFDRNCWLMGLQWIFLLDNFGVIFIKTKTVLSTCGI